MQLHACITLPKLATSLPSYLYVPLRADLQVKLTDNMSKEEVLIKNTTDLVSHSTKTDAAGNADDSNRATLLSTPGIVASPSPTTTLAQA